MSSTPTSTNEEATAVGPAIASPQDQLDTIEAGTPNPPSDLHSASSDFSNVDSSNIEIGTTVAPDDSSVRKAFCSSPLDSKPAARSSPAAGLPSSASDGFLSSILAAATPTNPSRSFSNVGSAASNRIGYSFSNFDVESLNGMFGTLTPVNGAANAASPATAAAAATANEQQQVPPLQPMMDAFPLPSYLQAQMDETYAASTLVFPAGYDANGDDNVFYQVTAYRHMGGNMVQSTVNYVPSAADQDEKENVRIPPLLKTSGKSAMPPRKRTIDVHESRPAAGKKMLIRHNLTGEHLKCSCKSSRCLKLYCECFRNGKVCNANECGCVSCKNTIANSGPHGIRTKTITEILRRRPDAFEKRERTQEGCRCKKNQCLKKYCVCFNAGVHCDGNKCQCNDCQNFPMDRREDEEAKPLTFVTVPANDTSLLDDADTESMSHSSSEELLDKRKRHSKRTRRNNPQYQESPGFYIGSPSPVKSSETEARVEFV